MDFISNKKQQQQEMLAAVGVNSIEELFYAIPPHLLLKKSQEDDGLSELEGQRFIEALAVKNTFPLLENYIGAGAYEHHVPALVGSICSKSEFLTCYTPYQAEASQGTLQTIFEFQSCLCALTGLDIANASLYDAASACAEAMLMAIRHTKKQKIILAESLNPLYRRVIEQYLCSHETPIEIVPFMEDGKLDLKAIDSILDNDTAAVLVQYPNFLGSIDDIREIANKAHQSGALLAICANPLVYGLYASASELGADIAIGDCQPFGIPLQFGGPYAGYMACRQDLVRQLPGRIVGETVDANGERGYVLTLQTREQQIRREKATSNICTNQALAALASLIGMLWYGKEGIPKLALTNFQRASYLKEKLSAVPGVKILNTNAILNEFSVCFQRKTEDVLTIFRKNGIEPGIHLGRYFPKLKDYFLVAVTETKNKQQLDQYIEVVQRELS